MNNKFLSRIVFVNVLFAILFNSGIVAQSEQKLYVLETKFTHYEILNIHSKEILSQIKANEHIPSLKISLNNGAEWDLNLRKTKLISPSYVLTIQKGDGITETIRGTNAIPMHGSVNGLSNSEVALTFNDNFIYGFIRHGGEEYYIEPLQYYTKSNLRDKFVIYNVKDIKDKKEYKCGYEVDKDELKKARNHANSSVRGSRMPGECIEIRYNTASDFSIYNKYGGASGAENHHIGVMNDVQTNYDNEFADEISFLMGQQWMSACSTCDPWTSSTNAEVLIESFTDWGPSGFSTTHDLAGLWTNRNLDGPTVGIAWLGVLCTNFKYHVLQDWTGSPTSLRVMTAHEIGHNFNADHDASGSNTIMAPSVNSATTWSAASISAIQTEYSGAGCLGNCVGSGQPPIADFTYDINSFCVTAQVSYTDLSSNVVSRSWSFPGGTPSTSTAANPVVLYNQPGTYGATLVVNNTFGTDQIFYPDVVTVQDFPNSNFSFTVAGNTATFSFTGNDAFSYIWDFGDNQFSYEPNPIHTFQNDGVYNVKLTVNNDCGNDIKIRQVTIATPPTAMFSSNVVAGCQPLTVNFTSLSSSNSVGYLWTFTGGNPSTSTLQNPQVVYSNPGEFSVSLKVTNPQGQDTEIKNDFISVAPVTVPTFTYTANGAIVSFNNASQNATSYIWNFGDGNTSTLQNPTHTYLNNGVYTVSMSAINDCGTNVTQQTVTIALPPVAGFSASNSTICSGQSVTFQNTPTYNPTSYLWTFEGGTPATSMEANPTVLFNQSGTYDVTLLVSNANGSNQATLQNFVTVNATPILNLQHVNDGLTVYFSSNVLNGSNIVWNFGDGQTSTQANPTHVYTAEGTYLVSLTANNSCGPTSVQQNVQVQLAPNAGFSAVNTVGCSPGTIAFNNASSPSATSYLWSFEGGVPSTSTEKNPVVTFNNPGIYDVTLTVFNNVGQGTSTKTDYIQILTMPATGFNTSVSDNIINLTNTAAAIDSVRWIISGNGQTYVLTGSNTNFEAPQNGNYSVTQVTYNQCGFSTSTSQTLEINAYPISSFGISGACKLVPVLFSSTSSNADSIKWTINGVTYNNINRPSVVFDSAGSYFVQLISYNHLGSDTLESAVIVKEKLLSGFTHTSANGLVSFTYTGENPVDIEWIFGDGVTDSIPNPVHTYSSSGTYLVTQISHSECGSDTTKATLSIIVSKTKDEDFGEVNIYPNPNSGSFYIEIDNRDQGVLQFMLLDMLGRVVGTNVSDHGQGLNSKKIEILHPVEGSYFLKIVGPSGNKTKKIIIQK